MLFCWSYEQIIYQRERCQAKNNVNQSGHITENTNNIPSINNNGIYQVWTQTDTAHMGSCMRSQTLIQILEIKHNCKLYKKLSNIRFFFRLYDEHNWNFKKANISCLVSSELREENRGGSGRGHHTHTQPAGVKFQKICQNLWKYPLEYVWQARPPAPPVIFQLSLFSIVFAVKHNIFNILCQNAYFQIYINWLYAFSQKKI